MIKKKQLNTHKRTSIEKTPTNIAISQRKSREGIKVDGLKDKAKQAKNQKSGRPVSQQRSRSKGNSHENIRQAKKSSHEVDQLIMKKDLKMLLAKKGIRKVKQASIVPDILKKIQQNCRILKKIDQLEHHPSHKKSTKQSFSNSKSFKHSHCNNKSENPINKCKTKSRQVAQQSARVSKKSRRSYEISNQNKAQQKIQLKLSSKIKASSKPANIVEVVKQYKKIIDREDLRVEKSSKNTNYNSNQSRNSSSLHNSHNLFNIIESMSKNHRLEESSSTMDKIQGLIKQQQNYIQVIKSEKPQIDEQTPYNSSNLALEKKQTEQNHHESHKKMNEHVHNKKNETMKKQDKQDQFKFDNQLANNAACLKENEKSARAFQQSKYYVQPIPPFKGKKSQDDSLLGCEIPLVENYIINDSDLPELQL